MMMIMKIDMMRNINVDSTEDNCDDYVSFMLVVMMATEQIFIIVFILSLVNVNYLVQQIVYSKQ